VAGGGAAINAVSLAELCVGDAEPKKVADRIRKWGVEVLDVPAAAAGLCARACSSYRRRHKRTSGKDALSMPLPDFFIGAHALLSGWSLRQGRRLSACNGRASPQETDAIERALLVPPSILNPQA
jgi:predicted nucleic acid-binding protein